TSSSPNIQNLPRKGGMRECFVPRPGYVFAAADYEQMELRTVAQVCLAQFHFSRLAEALNAGLDPHLEMAARIVGVSYEEALRRKKAGDEAIRDFKKGDEVEAVVLAIDTERERISLGIKQMDGDPFTSFSSATDKGSLVRGIVKSVDAKGVIVDLGGDTDAYLRASEISRERVEDARNHFKEGDSVEAMVVNIDRKTRSISLSIKAKETAETADALNRMQAENSAQSGTTNLGALLRAKLDGQ
ncbi:MAG: S1 RNA-binding domain-containing protein, partial [Betaproteobacteria bacterium]|nr:S1 RNA-binding domain-containing protein [Betaproteobacteria bacterium]